MTRFQPSGFDRCIADGDPPAPYQAPSGPLASRVACSRQGFTMATPTALGWHISYK